MQIRMNSFCKNILNCWLNNKQETFDTRVPPMVAMTSCNVRKIMYEESQKSFA